METETLPTLDQNMLRGIAKNELAVKSFKKCYSILHFLKEPKEMVSRLETLSKKMSSICDMYEKKKNGKNHLEKEELAGLERQIIYSDIEFAQFRDEISLSNFIRKNWIKNNIKDLEDYYKKHDDLEGINFFKEEINCPLTKVVDKIINLEPEKSKTKSKNIILKSFDKFIKKFKSKEKSKYETELRNDVETINSLVAPYIKGFSSLVSLTNLYIESKKALNLELCVPIEEAREVDPKNSDRYSFLEFCRYFVHSNGLLQEPFDLYSQDHHHNPRSKYILFNVVRELPKLIGSIAADPSFSAYVREIEEHDSSVPRIYKSNLLAHECFRYSLILLYHYDSRYNVISYSPEIKQNLIGVVKGHEKVDTRKLQEQIDEIISKCFKPGGINGRK